MPPLAPRVRDAASSVGIVLAIAAGLAFGAQRWAGVDTPDSSFYATLSLFGDEVTDRAPFPSYFWTRIGVIAPMRALTTIFGPWVGFAAYRALLILLIVAATWLIMRRFTGRTSAAAITIALGTSSVILSYLGNTYLTGAVLAGTVALMAAALSARWWSAIPAGVLLAWLVMANPPGALLAGTLWLAIRIWHLRIYRSPVRKFLGHLALTAGTTILGFLALLQVGRMIFPRMDWFGSYLDAQQITLSNFASATPVWLTDISMIVPLVVLIVSIKTWWMSRQTSTAVPASLAVVVSVTSIAFMLVFNPLMGGIALEAPMYQAMLWPPALTALGCCAACWLPRERWRRAQIGIAIAGLIVVVACGFLTPGMSLILGAAIALVLLAFLVFALHRRPRPGIWVLAAWLALLAGFQLLQNSRGDLGLYYLSPYAWAYQANPVSAKVHESVNAQQWLLDRTTRSDQILVWVDGPWTRGDRELYVAAGMQLWGENRITLEPTLSDAYGRDRLQEVRPSVIAMYGKTMAAVDAFWASLPAVNQPTRPECYDFPWPADPSSDFPTSTGHACLTRLSWPARGA